MLHCLLKHVLPVAQFAFSTQVDGWQIPPRQEGFGGTHCVSAVQVRATITNKWQISQQRTNCIQDFPFFPWRLNIVQTNHFLIFVNLKYKGPKNPKFSESIVRRSGAQDLQHAVWGPECDPGATFAIFAWYYYLPTSDNQFKIIMLCMYVVVEK